MSDEPARSMAAAPFDFADSRRLMPRNPFRRKTLASPSPDVPPAAARTARLPTVQGGSGRYHTAGYLQYDETNVQLQGKLGIAEFDKMWRTDADARRAITMIVNPIVGGTWEIQPYGDEDDLTTSQDEQVASFVEWALTDHMRPKLTSHLWTALTVAARAGFAPFEHIYELATWQDRPVFAVKTLDLRIPQSIDRWLQNGPDLEALEQFAPGTSEGLALGSTTTHIPAAQLIYYRFGAEGDNWEGQSLLRPAFKHWKYKDTIELIQAMAIERTAMGVPTGYPPDGAGQADLDTFAQFLANVRSSEAAYFLAPGPYAQYAEKGQGWFWEFVTPHASRGDSTGVPEALKYHSDKIASTVIGEFMRQGVQGSSGTNAAADTQQDPFLAFAEAICSIVIEDAINEQLIPRLVDLNFQVDGRYPKLKCSLIDSTTLSELADYVQKLADVGALTPEPTLEAFLRARADLPERDEQAIAQQDEKAAQQAADQAAAKASSQPDGGGGESSGQPASDATTMSLARQDRPLRAWEQTMSLDRIESTIDGARDSLIAAAGDQARQLALDLARTRRIRPADPPTELVDAIESELEHLYEVGRQTVVEELARQAGGPLAATLAASDIAAGLRDRAQAAADAIRAAIVAAINRARLQRTADQASVQLAAEQAAVAGLRTEAQNHAAAALNLGRSDQATENGDQIAGTYYTSILDPARCSACAGADDDVLRPLDDPVRLAHEPPNPGCQGGSRCRCMEAFIYASEAPPSV